MVTATSENTTVHMVNKTDLPLHCPSSEMNLWNLHPKVYLPIEKTGQAQCPYCGTVYQLTTKN